MEKHCNAQVEKEFNLNGRLPESLGKWYLLQRLLPSHALRSVLGEDAIPVPRACNKKVAQPKAFQVRSPCISNISMGTFDAKIATSDLAMRSTNHIDRTYAARRWHACLHKVSFNF